MTWWFHYYYYTLAISNHPSFVSTLEFRNKLHYSFFSKINNNYLSKYFIIVYSEFIFYFLFFWIKNKSNLKLFVFSFLCQRLTADISWWSFNFVFVRNKNNTIWYSQRLKWLFTFFIWIGQRDKHELCKRSFARLL